MQCLFSGQICLADFGESPLAVCTLYVRIVKKGGTFFGPSFPQGNLSRSIVNWSDAVLYCVVFGHQLLTFF